MRYAIGMRGLALGSTMRYDDSSKKWGGTMAVLYYPSPVGLLRLQADEVGLCRLDRVEAPENAVPAHSSCPVLEQARQQLKEYFAGERRRFTVPLHLQGTPFQLKAWAALQAIPYGQTRSYAQQAAALGNPKACRAVGMANHRNPVMIFVPCHRVIGANGSLTGFGGGLAMKQALLDLEAKYR